MTTSKTWIGWLVHLYTATGLIAAGAIATSIIRGTPEAFAVAFLWMILATFIDGTDGWLARRVGVKALIPSVDGRRLDDIIDYLNYTFLPVLLMWRAELLPPDWEGIYVLVLMASVYGFCQSDAKTAEGYFLGFPSYWNVVALYLFYLGTPPVGVAVTLLGLSALTLVPSRYLYPSQEGTLNRVTCVLGLVWGVSLGCYLFSVVGQEENPFPLWTLAFPVYYMVASFVVEARHRFSSAS